MCEVQRLDALRSRVGAAVMSYFDIVDWANQSDANSFAFYATFLPFWGIVLVGITAAIERWWKP